MLVFLFISKTKKELSSECQYKTGFSCKICFFSNLVKVIGFRDFYFKDYTATMGSNSVETFIDSFGF